MAAGRAVARRLTTLEDAQVKRQRAAQGRFLNDLMCENPKEAIAIIVWCYLQRDGGVDAAFADAERWACGGVLVPSHQARAWGDTLVLAHLWAADRGDEMTDAQVATMDSVLAWVQVAPL